jgi:phospholipid-binding lipoprotein MlaA
MKLFSGLFKFKLKPIAAISGIFLFCLSSACFAQNTTDQDRRFWEEWNEYIVDIIQAELATPDPWEPLNRKVFAFNDVADRYALTPAAKTYRWITPDLLETGIGNMFSNLFEITTILNDLLQLKFTQAGLDSGRFLINTTVGLAGFFDVASAIGLEKNNEDFGQTMGYWGIGAGPYVVVPLLGSFTVRDGLGAYIDVYYDYFEHMDHIPTRNQMWLIRTLHNRASLFTAEELITGDRYTFIRDAYLQRRHYLVNDGVVIDSFGEEDYDENWDDDGWDEE